MVMTDRARLADLIERTTYGDETRCPPSSYGFALADAILAAGWRPPVVHWGCNGQRLPGAAWCACGATVFDTPNR